MLSVILPYWRRAPAAQAALALYEKNYAGKLDFEVILVDDGSHDIDIAYPWLRIERLPKKNVPKNPCVPINHGARMASGDVLVISCAEIRHNAPVFPKMLEELQRIGENGYVLAACWYEAEKSWHCHSHITADGYHQQIAQPKGSGFHFCGMLNRSLWDRAGGFDEEYRDGAFYDDPDFVNRLARAGAIFKIRDDLVVEHVREGCEPIEWIGRERNQKLFQSKWNG